MFWNFEINFISLINPYFYMNKKSRQKIKFLENENSFWKWNKIKWKTFFIIFKGLSVAKNYLGRESARLESPIKNIIL